MKNITTLLNNRFSITILIILFFASCSFKNKNALFQSRYDAYADTSSRIFTGNPSTYSINPAYIIRPYDLITVKNLQNPLGLVETLNSASSEAFFYRSDSAGVITLPVIGKVQLAGLTIVEANEKIGKLYAEKLLKDPIIQVGVIDFKVTLLGDVNKQGNYELKRENTHLIEIIGQSGGLLPSADPKRIKIIRGDRSNPEIIYVNLKDINALANNKLILHSNDIIYIPSTGLFNTNENVRSYSNLLQPVLIILNGALLVYTLTRY